jgi:hypothetical protein
MIELQQTLTANAFEIASESFGITLDFSNSSINHVERILAELHRDYQRTRSDEGIRGVALSFAAYIVTVIERVSEPGVWSRDHDVVGPETFPYDWKGTTLFPYGWCLNRIINGDEDNVAVKYRALVLEKIGRVDELPINSESRKKWWQFWRS